MLVRLPLLVSVSLAVWLIIPACAERSGGLSGQRVIVLGFDGVDPGLVGRMMAEGRLPHLAALRDRGSFQPLGSTIPPQSPAAWASFATSLSPGNHGVFDYVMRDLRTYAPFPGVCYVLPPQFLPGGRMRQKAQAVNLRQGEPFWLTADRQGVRCKVLQVPFAFPPDPLEHGQMLSGAGVPEIGGLTTHFCSMSTEFTPEQLAEPLNGGVRVPLKFEGNHARAMVPGGQDGEQASGTRTLLELEVVRESSGQVAAPVTLYFQGKRLDLAVGAWSDWAEWTVPITKEHVVRAVSSFYLLEAGEVVRLYMSSLQFHPLEPLLEFTTPGTYAQELVERYGLYKTLGWAQDTTALRRHALDEDAFLEEARMHDQWVETLTLDELDRGQFDLLIAVWTSPDRVSHTFWRYMDPEHPLYSTAEAARYGGAVEDTYLRMDTIVGKVMERLQPEDLLFVISDHGFHSFRRAFSVNTWLLEQGYLALKPDTVPAAVAKGPDLVHRVDWSRTRAYALGMGAVYLNIQGREARGIVTPASAPALLEELRQRLLDVTDPATGEHIFTSIYTREVFRGANETAAPDLQLGYANGYQTNKQSAAGAVPKEVYEPNLDKWSGEHASSDAEDTPGILFSSIPILQDAAIIDLGVTALHYLGCTPPAGVEGKNLLEPR